MKRVISIGNALVDIIYLLENDVILEELGLKRGSMNMIDKDFDSLIDEKMKVHDRILSSGGSAANTINGLANLGIDTCFMGVTGEDEYGKFFREDMLSNNIKPILYTSDKKTGTARTFVSHDAERTFAVHIGAASELTVNIRETIFKDYDYLHIEGYLVYNRDLMLKIGEYGKRNGLKISLDLASYNVVEENIDFLKDYVKKYVNILFSNEEEAKAYSNMMPIESLNMMSKEVDIAVVKLGSKGSIIKRGDEFISISPVEVDTVIDTTGAGDMYAAGFLYGIISGLSLKVSGEIGSLLSSNVIKETGAKISKDKWIKIKDDIKRIAD